MISARALTKRFGNFTAVDRVSFEVGDREVLGFIGPNGAGKTTTMRMLTGYIPATEGSALVAGHDVFEDTMAVRRAVGYLPETPPLYRELTVGDYLHFVAEIREVPAKGRSKRIGEVMEMVGLAGWENRILGSLSKGFRQRVGLAQAIVHDPPVLVLDEPTSGLDPAQVVGIRDFVSALAEKRTVILSTHILPEVELLCRRVVIIGRGKVLADDTLDGLRERAGGGIRYRIELRGAPDEKLSTAVGGVPGVVRVTPMAHTSGTVHDDEGFLAMDVKAPDDPRTGIARLATEQGWQIRAMEKHTPSLEEAFLAVVGAER